MSPLVLSQEIRRGGVGVCATTFGVRSSSFHRPPHLCRASVPGCCRFDSRLASEGNSFLRSMASDPKVHSFQDVAKHNKTNDCWLIFSGKVYDVTPFMDEHPGGDEVLLSSTGKDATDDFEDVGHSDSARQMMDQYCIGAIDSSTMPPLKRDYIQAQQQDSYNPDKTPDFVNKILQFLVPLLILGLAFAVLHYTKNE